MPTHDVIIDNDVLAFIPKCFGGLLLDVGCGWGWFGFRLRIDREVRGLLIGLDVFAPTLRRLKKLNIYDGLVRADIRFIPFKDAIVDVVFATEVIEHLPKEEGYVFLDELDRVSRGMIIVTTPRGFFPQGAYDGNIFETHRSGWFEKDFVEKGYDVMLAGRSKILLKPIKTVTYYVNALAELLPIVVKKFLPKEYIIALKKRARRF